MAYYLHKRGTAMVQGNYPAEYHQELNPNGARQKILNVYTKSHLPASIRIHIVLQRFPKILQQPMKTEVRSRFTLRLMIGYFTILPVTCTIIFNIYMLQCKT